LYNLLKKLFPIHRSISGNGFNKTLDILSEKIDLKRIEFKTGSKLFDWTVPKVWNINSASIKSEAGETIVDIKENNLHIMSYSTPVSGLFSIEELKSKLHTLPDRPNAIPYMTSYYEEDWGFCISENQLKKLNDKRYYVEIDSSLKDGNLTIAEARIPGEVDKEILLSCYICHPSMANDSLSGVVVLSALYEHLIKQNNYYGYRFLFIPETIGSIAFLHKYKDSINNWLHAGLVCTCVGDKGYFNYKQSRQGKTSIDKVAANILEFSNCEYKIREFWPEGSDERQFCSPGFNLPVGSLMRSVYGEFPEYHNSDDNLNFVKDTYLNKSLELYKNILEGVQINCYYTNTINYCEPHFSKYKMYPSSGSHLDRSDYLKNMLWIMNYSDGKNDLVDIANLAKKSILDFKPVLFDLINKGLLVREL
jgi:aminopeptidase-like protein